MASQPKKPNQEIQYFFDHPETGKQQRVIKTSEENLAIVFVIRADADCPREVIEALFSISEVVANNDIEIEGWND